MSLKISLPDHTELKPRIVIIGVGGAGSNAVNNMIEAKVEGVDFWVANTDAQALKNSTAANKIQLGIASTKGLGAGSNPEVGKIAAQESIEQISNALDGCHMLFITAGMGGGTGTGGAPIISAIAKERGILTVGVVTKPFHFEGSRRMAIAELGLEELSRYVDTLIVIPNQNLFRIANEKTTFADAFKKADEVLRSGVTSITDLIIMPGLINLDFADIKTVMSEMGKAMMGTGEAEGDDRAISAAEAAISNPILDNASMKGARGVLINITGGSDMTLFEVDAAANRIKQEVDANANIIFGSAFNENLSGKMRVSVVATGIDLHSMPNRNPLPNIKVKEDLQTIDSSKQENNEYLNTPHTAQNVLANSETQESVSDNPINYISNSFSSISTNKSFFIPPKPLESDEYSANSSGNASNIPNDKLVNSSSASVVTDSNSSDTENLNPEQAAKGLFSKVSASFSKVNINEVNLDLKHKRDIFDIPAFLRKNKN